MYASVRKYQTTSGAAEEIGRRVEAGFVPIISQAPGFVAYYAVNAGNDVVVSVSVFQNQAGADESNRMAANWVKQNLASLLPNPAEITAGEVRRDSPLSRFRFAPWQGASFRMFSPAGR